MPPVVIRPLEERDVDEGDAIYREAFTTFLKLPPEKLRKGSYVRNRFAGKQSACFAAESNGKLIGTVFAANWGSVAVLGPCTTRMKGFTAQAGAQLVARAQEQARTWGAQHLVGYTFCDSPRHLEFFHTVDMWPRCITAVMTQLVRKNQSLPAGWVLVSAAGAARAALLEDCSVMTRSVWPGLVVTSEIETVATQNIGDTLVHRGPDGAVDALAVCHHGPGSEANENATYVKVGMVRSGEGAPARFSDLLAAVEAFASQRGSTSYSVGMNTAHHEAYRLLVQKRFMTTELGVSLHYKNDRAYKAEGCWVIDDWR